MLTIDREGERFVFENDWDLLIPFSMEQLDGGELSVSAIPSVAPVVRKFLRQFGQANPFSDAALAWLWERIKPFEEKWGYVGGRYRWRRCRVFRFPQGGALPAILLQTRLLCEKDHAKNKTTYSVADSLAAGVCMAGTLDGDSVVSVAVTHRALADAERGDAVEIGVETVPEARGRGYAVSSLSLVTSVLAERGIVAEYRCTRSNRASARVAERAGYRQIGEACYLLMRRDPNRRKGNSQYGV